MVDVNQLFPDQSQLVELPAIDMSEPDEQIIVNQIMVMSSTLGFFHLKNVPGFDEQELLRDMKEFHALPDEVKHTLKQKSHNPENSNVYRGFIPFIDNDPSHKEMLDMGCDYATLSEEEKRQPLVEETPFPTDPQYAHIKANYEKHYNFRLKLGLQLAEYIALGLGKDRHFFRAWFETEGMSTLRSIKYLPRSESNVRSDELSPDNFRLTTPEHTDSDFITMLTTFGYPGLQVPIDGEYKYVKPEPNNIVVNLGDLLSHVTNFRLKSTEHRVMDIGCERYSSPFFFAPKSSAVIPSNIVDPAEAEKADPIMYGHWIARVMKRFGEWKEFDLEGAGVQPAEGNAEQPSVEAQ